MIYQDSLTSESSNTSSHTSSGLFDDDQDNMADLHGTTFKERVDHLLTVNEKSHLSKILTTYNRDKYASSFEQVCQRPNWTDLDLKPYPHTSTIQSRLSIKVSRYNIKVIVNSLFFCVMICMIYEHILLTHVMKY